MSYDDEQHHRKKEDTAFALIRHLLEEQAQLKKALTKAKSEASSAKAQARAYRTSTSWKLTAIIRFFATLLNMQSKAHGSAPSEASNTETNHTAPRTPKCIKPVASSEFASHLRIGVHAHIFHEDLIHEIFTYLKNIPQPFDLYLTSDSEQKLDLAKSKLRTVHAVEDIVSKVVPNRGRDLAPMLVALGDEVTKYDACLHIHTKKSPHNYELRGWRRHLLEALLGSPETIRGILKKLQEDRTLGVLYPAPYFPMKALMSVGDNAIYMLYLLKRARRALSDFECIAKDDFPAGSMFWFKGPALLKLHEIPLVLEDFDSEMGQTDGTLAHAVERMIPYFAAVAGYASFAYLPQNMHAARCIGAAPFNKGAARRHIDPGINIHLIIDHNIGGGSNFFSKGLIEKLTQKGESVLRLFFDRFSMTWILEIADADSSAFFSSEQSEPIFNLLQEVDCRRIIINSLVSVPNVREIICRVIRYAEESKVPIEFKVHDFHALCPSPHLLDFKGKYCDVPRDLSVCEECLQKNSRAFYPLDENATISSWRANYADLLTNATKITVFDKSSLAYLSRVFGDALLSKVALEPHDDVDTADPPAGPLGPIHVGVFGTATAPKGASVVNELAKYLSKEDLNIPITAIGDAKAKMHERIFVHGAYENSDLPQLVRRYGITVVFFASVMPETFSFVISEAKAMGLPIVAFDLGAQGRRVSHYKFGRVLPLNAPPRDILQALVEVWQRSNPGHS